MNAMRRWDPTLHHMFRARRWDPTSHHMLRARRSSTWPIRMVTLLLCQSGSKVGVIGWEISDHMPCGTSMLIIVPLMATIVLSGGASTRGGTPIQALRGWCMAHSGCSSDSGAGGRRGESGEICWHLLLQAWPAVCQCKMQPLLSAKLSAQDQSLLNTRCSAVQLHGGLAACQHLCTYP